MTLPHPEPAITPSPDPLHHTHSAHHPHTVPLPAQTLPPTTLPISLEAVIAMTGRSRRTWWRRIEEGAITKLPADARGRAQVRLCDVASALPMHGRFALQDWHALARADAGDAQAQAEVGALLALWAHESPHGRRSALYWLEQASAHNQPDAMHWLAVLHGAELVPSSPLTPAPTPNNPHGHAAGHVLPGHHLGNAPGHSLGYGPAATVTPPGHPPAYPDAHALVLMWLGRAAAAGHVIARHQLNALMAQAGMPVGGPASTGASTGATTITTTTTSTIAGAQPGAQRDGVAGAAEAGL